MEQTEKDKIIGKIKKLFALGMKDPETPEAMSAMTKAKEMMDKYNLETIDMNDDGTIDPENIERMDIPFEFSNTDWEGYLMMEICKTFQCEYVRTGMQKGGNRRHVMIGSKTDISFASFLFKFVRLQIMKMCDGYNYNVKDTKTYCMAAVLTVSGMIEKAFSKSFKVQTEDQIHTHHALMVVKNDAVATRVKEIFPKLKKGRPMAPLRGSDNAFFNGSKDGNKVKLNRQLGAGSETNRLRN